MRSLGAKNARRSRECQQRPRNDSAWLNIREIGNHCCGECPRRCAFFRRPYSSVTAAAARHRRQRGVWTAIYHWLWLIPLTFIFAIMYAPRGANVFAAPQRLQHSSWWCEPHSNLRGEKREKERKVPKKEKKLRPRDEGARRVPRARLAADIISEPCLMSGNSSVERQAEGEIDGRRVIAGPPRILPSGLLAEHAVESRRAIPAFSKGDSS